MITTANIFEAVKTGVSVRDAAECYGIRSNHAGMACCPFHDDHTPSMKLNEDYFYCFGCGAGGDVITFTARLFKLRPYEAARKLASDFNIPVDIPLPEQNTLSLSNDIPYRLTANVKLQDDLADGIYPLVTHAGIKDYELGTVTGGSDAKIVRLVWQEATSTLSLEVISRGTMIIFR